MPGELTATVTVEGIAKLLRRLNSTEPIYAKPWAEGLKEAADLLERDIKMRAPRGQSGRLEANISTRMQARPVPMWAKVGEMPMATNKSFRYPGALEGGAKYHYRSGPFAGQSTKGWLIKSMQMLQSKVTAILSRAASEIERTWGE